MTSKSQYDQWPMMEQGKDISPVLKTRLGLDFQKKREENPFWCHRCNKNLFWPLSLSLHPQIISDFPSRFLLLVLGERRLIVLGIISGPVPQPGQWSLVFYVHAYLIICIYQFISLFYIYGYWIVVGQNK